ncbi:hypothetical protein [Variovorax sp. OK605]|uniref:hypothetical protein n=1 Tax=Variovorax sp. OK605 TaxID=1855317 RepID=UPI0011602C6A|nr:hypothetical protein [Variovorax sp. OK605]
MLARRAHFWLCCMPGQMEDYEERLSGTPMRIQRAKEPLSKFGPYSYIFIDSPKCDEPIDFVLKSLLDILEPYAEMMLGLDKFLSGINVEIKSTDPRYSEQIDSETFVRFAALKLDVAFAFEHVPEDVGISSNLR